ncbi:cystathionine beta-synthase-like [Thrips palmi]|uniref:Cystathionine beta-synthase n=1 Tax=Thrips palmi TaxID=161013 RepID=A0A6P8ZIB3_THRPL|nr:cystathionine beta-synthase-like [Thrips palmi]
MDSSRASNGRCPAAKTQLSHSPDSLDIQKVFSKLLSHEDSFDMKSDFRSPDRASKCTWHLGADPVTSPHAAWQLPPREKILPSILSAIGKTPMVRLNKIPKSCGLSCEMVVKCEFLNPAGGVKDRIALRMVEEAEEKGLLKPGGVIIEASSGNTGIGLAMVAAVKGYRCIICIPDRMSMDKVHTLNALGAEVLRVDSTAPFDSPDMIIAVSQRLQREIPNSVLMNQFTNPSNPLAHYETTAQEIVDDCGGQVDMLVFGVGTGGTATGLCRKIKELCPNVKIIGADPMGSILAQPSHLNKPEVPLVVEGIGYVFVPTTADRSLIDQWYKIEDVESYTMARRLIREEGFLSGGSSGCIMSAAVKAAASLKEGQRCVVILPDNVRNYLTNFTNDTWMEARGHIESPLSKNLWWSNEKVSALKLKQPLTVSGGTSCKRSLQIMKEAGISQLPVINDLGVVFGVVTKKSILSELSKGLLKMSDPSEKAMLRSFRKISSDFTLLRASKFLEIEQFLVVTQNQGFTQDEDTTIRVLTMDDVLRFIEPREEQK